MEQITQILLVIFIFLAIVVISIRSYGIYLDKLIIKVKKGSDKNKLEFLQKENEHYKTFCKWLDKNDADIEKAKKEYLNTIDGIADEVHKLAWQKGWHTTEENEDQFIERACNNLHDEISELHEAWRNNKLHDLCDKGLDMADLGLPTLTNIEEELADIIIRALDNARKLNVDISKAVKTKHAFNKSRSHRHGGKKS